MNNDRQGLTAAGGLEEVFRSQEFWRTTDAPFATNRDAHAWSRLRSGEEGPTTGTPARSVAPSPGTPDPTPHAAPAAGGAGAGMTAAGAPVPSGGPWRRQPNRYRSAAALSALVALVVAGVTSGAGQHSTIPITSAHGAQGRAHPRSHVRTSSPASTGPSTPGALTGDVAAGALALGVPLPAPHVSGQSAPAGRVTLGGAATTTGSAGSGPPVPTGSSGGGGGAPGLPSGSGGPDPLAPVTSTVGSGANSVGSAVSNVTSELASEVPAAAPATTAVNGAVSSAVSAVDQAVSATTL